MSGIRVIGLPVGCTENEIKIHFSKARNGGGRIQCIYYPLLNNDAVIMFENPETSDTVISTKKQVLTGTEPLVVQKLPDLQLFTEIEAKLGQAAAEILEDNEEIMEEMQYHFYNDNVEVIKDNNRKPVALRGNWYLLEWAWAFIDNFTKTQTETKSSQLFTRYCETRQSHEVANVDYETKTDAFCTETLCATQKDKPELLTKEAGATNDPENYEAVSKNDPVVEETLIEDEEKDLSSLKFKLGPVTVSVFNGFITLTETDAIVCPSTMFLSHYGGVANAIAEAASPEMRRECDIIKQRHFLKQGDVMHTSAGGEISNKVKYIIHSVVPTWLSRTEETRYRKELTKTVQNCLQYSNNLLKINTMTFPLLGYGSLGAALEICVESFLYGIAMFVDENEDICLQEIHLVNSDPNATAMTILHLRSMLSKDGDQLIARAKSVLATDTATYGSLESNIMSRRSDDDTDEEHKQTLSYPSHGSTAQSMVSRPSYEHYRTDDLENPSPTGRSSPDTSSTSNMDSICSSSVRSTGPPTVGYSSNTRGYYSVTPPFPSSTFGASSVERSSYTPSMPSDNTTGHHYGHTGSFLSSSDGGDSESRARGLYNVTGISENSATGYFSRDRHFHDTNRKY